MIKNPLNPGIQKVANPSPQPTRPASRPTTPPLFMSGGYQCSEYRSMYTKNGYQCSEYRSVYDQDNCHNPLESESNITNG